MGFWVVMLSGIYVQLSCVVLDSRLVQALVSIFDVSQSYHSIALTLQCDCITLQCESRAQAVCRVSLKYKSSIL